MLSRVGSGLTHIYHTRSKDLPGTSTFIKLTIVVKLFCWHCVRPFVSGKWISAFG